MKNASTVKIAAKENSMSSITVIRVLCGNANLNTRKTSYIRLTMAPDPTNSRKITAWFAKFISTYLNRLFIILPAFLSFMSV